MNPFYFTLFINANTSYNKILTVMKPKHHIYKQVKKVGSGNFGEAYLVESQLDHKPYIMKKLRLENRNKQSKQQILKEIKLMQNLSHCYIVKYLQSFVEGKEACIVMEYAQKGDLSKFLEKKKKDEDYLSQNQILSWFIQICLGLKYIHERKIVHRDLKPENIFITNDNDLIIGDFGISKLMSETLDMAKTKIGTPFIMAPQIWQGMKYNQKSDIWSLGCVLYKMMCFKYPFEAENSNVLMVKVVSHKEIKAVPGNYSKELKDLVMEILDRQAQRRPTIHKILQKPIIKRHMSQILETTINLPILNENSPLYCSKQSIKKNSSSQRLLSHKKSSLSSLSNSVLLPKTTNISSSTVQYTKMVEYKQNYPNLLEQNRMIKNQLEVLKTQKQQLENKSNNLLEKMRTSEVGRQELIDEFQNHITNYLYS